MDGIRSCIKQRHICVIEDHIMCVFLKFANKDIIFGWVPSHISLLWQTKLHSVKPVVGDWQSSYRQ